jgi:hypothetical protein
MKGKIVSSPIHISRKLNVTFFLPRRSFAIIGMLILEKGEPGKGARFDMSPGCADSFIYSNR